MVKVRELSQVEKERVISYHQDGFTLRKIGEKLKMPFATVQYIVNKWKKTGSIRNRSGRGRVAKTTYKQDRAILRKAKMDPRISAKAIALELQKEHGVVVSTSTIKRRLNSGGLCGKVAKKKPWISEKNKRKRLQWAREKVGWSLEDWKKVLFSDETKILLFGSDGIVRVWRKPKEGLKKKFLRPTIKHGGGKLHFDFIYKIALA